MLARWISALLAIVIFFTILFFFGSQGLLALSFFAVLRAAFEYSRLFENFSLWSTLFLILNMLIFTGHILFPQWTLALLVFSFIHLVAFGILFFREQQPQEILWRIQWTLWGVLYTGLFPSLTLRLMYEKGPALLIYLLLTVFVGDTFAFFVGKYFGSTKIFPNLSPKKTIAGGIGGLFGSCLVGSVFLFYFAPQMPVIMSALISLGLGLFGQFGDFFESLIKRVSGRKDTGRLMPGHGGILDRLDGVYFASPLFYFSYTLFNLAFYF